jgi:hypothetical protein
MAEPNIEIPQDYDYPTADHVIVWLDANIAKVGEYQQLKSAFATTLDPQCQILTKLTDEDLHSLCTNEGTPVCFAGASSQLLVFDNSDRCYESFERYKDKHVYLITSDTLGETIIPKLIRDYKKLFTDPVTNNPYRSIYILTTDVRNVNSAALAYPKYVLVFHREADLLARITSDVADYYAEQGKRYLQNALRRYQWSKKLFDRYKKMGENCKKEMENVEIRMADIESVIHPQISNPHVDRDNFHDEKDDDSGTCSQASG